MKPSIFLVLLFSLYFSTAIAQEQHSVIKPDLEFAVRLDELSKQKDLATLFRVANNPQTNEQLKAALDWMQSRAFYGNERDPRYLFSYARLLNHAGIVDTAILAYLTGVLVSRVEATRCKENAGARARIDELQAKWKNFEDGYWNLPANTRKKFLNLALGVERAKAKGDPIPWLCPARQGGEAGRKGDAGLKEIGIALEEALAGQPRVTVVEEPGKPKKIYIDTSGTAPEIITYEQSLPERKNVIEEFKHYYAQPERPN